MKKEVRIDNRANKEINKFPKDVQVKVQVMIDLLEERGRLSEPYAKKLKIKEKIYELRIRHKGQWRFLYAYIMKDLIIFLSAFKKKTQKVPKREIEKALRRLKDYI